MNMDKTAESEAYGMIRDKGKIKQSIIDVTLEAKKRNEQAIAALQDRVLLSDYRALVRPGAHGPIWTAALQTALNEHQIVIIPPSDEVYWLDDTVVIPSNRHIEAVGAVIAPVPEHGYVMLRNQHVHDGTHAPIDTSDRDTNISIHGGTWDEGALKRGTRRYHKDPTSFFGVQTCMLFNNLDHLTLTDLTFSRVASFCIQIGDVRDGVFENLFFRSCFADGLHINGNCENLYIRQFRGHVGDDLVALNMYDWLNSSINYGPCRNVFCEDIHSAPDSRSKAMRLLAGTFLYRDGTAIDCSLTNMYFRSLSGIFEYKLYFQSPPYCLGEKPEGGGAGTVDNLFFENVEVLSARPAYPCEHPETGSFGMFFLNSRIGYLSLESIHYHTDEGDSPQTYLVAVGPMTWRRTIGNRVDAEVFDPYVSGSVNVLDMKNILVNGERTTDVDSLVKVIEFCDVNHDGFSSGKGRIDHLFIDGKEIRQERKRSTDEGYA